MVTKYGIRFSDKIWGHYHYLIKRLEKLLFVKVILKSCIPWSNNNEIKGFEVENFDYDLVLEKHSSLAMRRKFCVDVVCISLLPGSLC